MKKIYTMTSIITNLCNGAFIFGEYGFKRLYLILIKNGQSDQEFTNGPK